MDFGFFGFYFQLPKKITKISISVNMFRVHFDKFISIKRIEEIHSYTFNT